MSSGREALAFLEREADGIDVVLLDLHMPEMSGFEVLDELRAKGGALPVIAFTARAMKGERERCLSAGFTDYLSKPVDRESLIERLGAHIDGGNENGEADLLRILVIEDHPDTGQALKFLLDGSDRTIRVAQSGAEAFDLAQRWRPDVCLLDRGLPDCDGVELARRIRALPGGSDVIQISVSGRALPDAVDETLFDHELLKPVDLDALEAILEGLDPKAQRSETEPAE